MRWENSIVLFWCSSAACRKTPVSFCFHCLLSLLNINRHSRECHGYLPQDFKAYMPSLIDKVHVWAQLTKFLDQWQSMLLLYCSLCQMFGVSDLHPLTKTRENFRVIDIKHSTEDFSVFGFHYYITVALLNVSRHPLSQPYAQAL